MSRSANRWWAQLPCPGSSVPGDGQQRDFQRLMVVPAALAHDLGQLVHQVLGFPPPTRERGGGAQFPNHLGHGQDDQPWVNLARLQQLQDHRPNRVRGGLQLLSDSWAWATSSCTIRTTYLSPSD